MMWDEMVMLKIRGKKENVQPGEFPGVGPARDYERLPERLFDIDHTPSRRHRESILGHWDQVHISSRHVRCASLKVCH